MGDRIGTSVLGYPTPDTIFVERVNKVKYSWDADGPSGWVLDVGKREPEDPLMRSFEMIREINSNISALGVW